MNEICLRSLKLLFEEQRKRERGRERERRKRRSSHPWEDRMKGERRGGKVEVEKRGGGWSGPSHSFMEIKDVISVPARTSLILSLYSVFLFPFLPLEARTSLPARHFLHATLAVDAANCKLISPLHFATRDRRPRHRSIFTYFEETREWNRFAKNINQSKEKISFFHDRESSLEKFLDSTNRKLKFQISLQGSNPIS